MGAEICDMLGFNPYWWFYGGKIIDDIDNLSTTTTGWIKKMEWQSFEIDTFAQQLKMQLRSFLCEDDWCCFLIHVISIFPSVAAQGLGSREWNFWVFHTQINTGKPSTWHDIKSTLSGGTHSEGDKSILWINTLSKSKSESCRSRGPRHRYSGNLKVWPTDHKLPMDCRGHLFSRKKRRKYTCLQPLEYPIPRPRPLLSVKKTPMAISREPREVS